MLTFSWDDRTGILTIHTRVTVRYRIQCEGDGYRLEKLDVGSDPEREEYAVRDGKCGCKGYFYHGHCKHLAAVAMLRSYKRV